MRGADGAHLENDAIRGTKPNLIRALRKRLGVVLLAAVLSGVAIGGIEVVGMTHRGPDNIIVFSTLGGILGGAAGLMAFPILNLLVGRRSTGVLLLPFLVVLLVWPALRIVTNLWWTGMFSFVVLLVAATMVRLTIRPLALVARGCVNCGYDVGHAPHPVCPECGQALGPEARSVEFLQSLRREHFRFHPANLNRRKALAVVIGAGLMVAYLCVTKLTRASFDEQAFLLVEPGMSATSVVNLLGKPDTILRVDSNTKVWRYTRWVGPVRDADYEVTLTNNIVEATYVDRY